MSEQTRIQVDTLIHRHDTEANWVKNGQAFIPEKGELIVYDVDDTHSEVRIKFGNGVDVLQDLEFYTQDILEKNSQLNKELTTVINFTNNKFFNVSSTPDIIEVANNRYRDTTGNSVTSYESEEASLWSTYLYKPERSALPKYISVFTYSNKLEDVSAVSFYSSGAVFISSIETVKDTTQGQWYIVEVPSNCTQIRISCLTANIPTIYYSKELHSEETYILDCGNASENIENLTDNVATTSIEE